MDAYTYGLGMIQLAEQIVAGVVIVIAALFVIRIVCFVIAVFWDIICRMDAATARKREARRSVPPAAQ
jgi:hypothetical protein